MIVQVAAGHLADAKKVTQVLREGMGHITATGSGKLRESCKKIHKSRSREAGGLAKAWETLHAQPFGNYVLGTVAVGFIAFAVFGLIEGFYRKRRPVSS